jgi:sulfate permease, SulP family
MLRALGVYDSLAHEEHLFARTPEAIAHARIHVARTPHGPSGDPVERVEPNRPEAHLDRA